AVRKLFEELTTLDASAPAPLGQSTIDKGVQTYNLRRVALMDKILEQVKGSDQETWIKQIFDNLSAAYQAGHAPSLTTLAQRRDQLVRTMPGSNLAAYGAYRHLWASYAEKLLKDPGKVQEEW